MTATIPAQAQTYAAGMKVEIRDEEWLVTSVERTTSGAYLLHVRGVSELVRDTDAAFFTDLDDARPVRPEDTKFVEDKTSHFLESRLFIDSVIRNLPVPRSDESLHVAQHQLLHDMRYQQIPTVMALRAQQPRLLIADAVGLGKTSVAEARGPTHAPLVSVGANLSAVQIYPDSVTAAHVGGRPSSKRRRQ